MILYNKSGIFLGMGNSELSLLGFEDMDEFQNYHNDIADLFVNKPGYIFKFQNFSWIEYALHSGTPNKRVLIKTKNGKEVDIALNIHEILLAIEKDGAKQYYAIELTNAPSKIGNLALRELEKTPSESINPSFFEPLPEQESPKPLFAHEERAKPLFQPADEPPFSTKTLELPEEESSKIFDEVQDVSRAVFFEEPTLPNIPLMFPIHEEDTQEEEETFQLKAEFPQEDVLEPSLMFDDTQKNEEIISVPKSFDIVESAELLGLDLVTFAELLEEYVYDLEARMNEIAKAITQGDTSLGLAHVEHLQNVARYLNIGELVEHFADLDESLRHHDEEGKVHTLLLIENVIADFKSSLH